MKSRQARPVSIGARRERGLSLVELLVASAIGLIIVAALAQIFVDISRTNQEMAKTNSQIESARLAIQLLEQDIMHAGFWDTHVPDFDNLSFTGEPLDVPADIPDPCLAYSTANWTDDFKNQLVGVPIQVSGTAPGSCGGVVVNQRPGTDVLVVRHAWLCEPGATNCDDPNTPGGMYFQASVCEDDAVNFALDPNALPALTDMDCTPGTAAPDRKFVQNIYYIRDWFANASDGIPTLVRSSFDVDSGVLAQQPAVPLVAGIEQLRVEIGIDDFSEPYPGFPDGSPADPNAEIDWEDINNWETPKNRGDGSPDGDFVHCPSPSTTCTVSDFLNVVAVKLYVLARASEPSGGFVDDKTYTLGSSGTIIPTDTSFKRHAFGTTIRVENISGRRETP